MAERITSKAGKKSTTMQSLRSSFLNPSLFRHAKRAAGPRDHRNNRPSTMAKRKFMTPAGQIRKLRRVEPAAGEHGPVPVYLASRLEPAGQESSWTVQSTGKEPKVTGQLDGLTFESSSPDFGALPPCRYAVGVLNKETGVMDYCLIQGQGVLRLHPCTQVDDEQLRSTPGKLDRQAQAYAQHAYAPQPGISPRLTRQFGSQTAKRKLEARLAAAVSAEAVGDTQSLNQIMDSAAGHAQAAGAGRDEVMAQLESLRNIPPHNPAATSPDEAYRLEDLVPQGCWHCLGDAQLARAISSPDFLEKLRAGKRFPDVVLDQLAGLSNPPPDADQRKRCLQAWALAGNLMSLLTASRTLTAQSKGAESRLRSISQQVHMPEEVLGGLLDQHYTCTLQGGGKQVYAQNDTARTRMRMFALVAALLASSHRLGPAQFEALRTCMRTPANQMVKMLREVGCLVSSTPGPTNPSGAKGAPQYNTVLMGASKPSAVKTLAECLPRLKAGRAQ